jgi:hypothetical protein
MYTRVNDIMRLERGPGSSLDEALLAACLKAVMADQFLADLMVPAAVCEPICVNQATRTTLLATMPMLDDINIAPVQRGDQSHSVVIPRAGGPAGAMGGHDRPAAVASPRQPAAVVSWQATPLAAPAPAPVKGKHARAIRDDDEVSFDEDENLQKRLRWPFGAVGLSGSGPTPTMPGAVATTLAVDKRVMEEATTSRPWRRRQLTRGLTTRALRVKPQ